MEPHRPDADPSHDRGRIRNMTLADVPAVRLIDRSVSSVLTIIGEPLAGTTFGDSTIFLATVDHRVVGLAAFTRRGRRLRLVRVAVMPGPRRQDTERALVRLGLRLAVRNGAGVLHCTAGLAAGAFLAENGFVCSSVDGARGTFVQRVPPVSVTVRQRAPVSRPAVPSSQR
ncbi:hypothetical protein ACX8Z9_04665 [Arthrobacter halodurans]|uniref:N-acetyltransferase domain-containing protein n=1 Tax=Arthrobacter halodurans TaxID=516699 RepID=A0ABV4UPW2_9MICC